MTKLTVKRLRELIHYHPANGSFIWIKSPAYNKSHLVGAVAGSLRDGYRVIFIDRKCYQASKLAWLYMTGKLPDCPVDHKDRNHSNDEWKNLRLATVSQNNANRRSPQNKGPLPRGVYIAIRSYRLRKPYGASIKVNGKCKYLGMFDTPEQAHSAYKNAAKKYFGEFAI
jgi:hypothetical protein